MASMFIPYAELERKQQVLVNSKDRWDRVYAAEQGYGLDKLFSDKDYLVRKAVAEHGYALDKLVDDEALSVRLAVAEQGFGLDKLVDDPEWYIRCVVARQGYALDKLVDDEGWCVRKAVAEQGYALDKLVNDVNEGVRLTADKFLEACECTLEEWIAANPDKCALEKNRAKQSKQQRAVERAAANKLPDLSVACKVGDFNKAINLLKSGANPNEKSYEGKAPLFYCNEVAFVCLLEHYGADVNTIDNEGNTPLFKFLTSENVKSNGTRAIIALIEAGADVDHSNNSGKTPRTIANSEADYDLRAAFMQGVGIVEKREEQYQELIDRQRGRWLDWRQHENPTEVTSNWEKSIYDCFVACSCSDLEVLKAHEDLIRDNLRVKIGGHGCIRSMLMEACTNGSAEIVEYLISLGADVNQIDDTGQAPLRYAAISWRDAVQKIDLLVAAGADVNHVSNDGSAALSDAAYQQNAKAAKALIDHGANVNNRDKQGYTALSWTCGKGAPPEIEIVETLLREGANVGDLYDMNCVLQYVDYDAGLVMLRSYELEERYLYEHALMPAMLTEDGHQQLQSEGFYF